MKGCAEILSSVRKKFVRYLSVEVSQYCDVSRRITDSEGCPSIRTQFVCNISRTCKGLNYKRAFGEEENDNFILRQSK